MNAWGWVAVAIVATCYVACLIRLAYVHGHCDGWLQCDEEHLRPALEGWERANAIAASAFDDLDQANEQLARIVAVRDPAMTHQVIDATTGRQLVPDAFATRRHAIEVAERIRRQIAGHANFARMDVQVVTR